MPTEKTFPEKWVPFYEDSERAWGAIKRIKAIPCTSPAAVYVEAAVNAAWKVAWSIIEPDEKELYHQFAGNSMYHSIKQGLEDLHIVPPRDESKFTRGLFFLADLRDVDLWYMFLFGSITDGLIDFSTQIQKHPGCNPDMRSHFFQGGPYINAIGDDGRWYADLFDDLEHPGIGHVGTCTARMSQGRSGFVAASCQFSDFDGLAVVSTDTGVIDTANSQLLDVGSSGSHTSLPATIGHTWYDLKNNKSGTREITIQSRYTGGIPLPLHEAFRHGDNWRGYAFNPG